MFVPGKPFQSSAIFAGKAAAYPSEAPAIWFILGNVLTIILKPAIAFHGCEEKLKFFVKIFFVLKLS